jgi:protein-S-isoprenylcysteine O-methyltransferase Ste14
MNQISTTAAKLSPFSRLLMRVPVPWVFVLGYFAGVGLQLTVFPRLRLFARTAHVIVICGAVLFMIGAIVAGWGLLLFYKACTTTTPGKASNALVTHGPYRITRNPMYVGLTIAYLGEMGLLVEIAPIIPLLLVIAYLNWIVIPVEEGQLREIFGEDYVHYSERVGRWWL